MGIVYDDPPATIQYDQPSPSADVFERGAPPVTTGLVAPTPDKYQQAAIAERDRLLAAKVPLPEGFTRRLASGPFLGWADELSAAGMTPAAMLQYGTWNPAEGYRYAKAREDLANQAAAEKTGLTGDVLETIGGLATLPGNVFGREAAAALGGGGKGVLPAAARMAGYGAEAGTLGAIQGAGNARTTEDIAHDALMGGALGGVLGAPFGAFANVARRSTAAVPSEAELFNRGKGDYRARDKVPVSYDLEKVGDRISDLQQATRQKYGRDAKVADQVLGSKADEAYRDVAAANALNPNPPNQVATAGSTGAPNRWQAVAAPRDIASLRREIYEESARGTPTDTKAGAVASKIVDRILSRPDPAMLANGTMRDAIAAAALDARGRANFAAQYRSKAVTEAVDNAINASAGAGSGLNFENTLRQHLNRARKNDAFGNFNPAEEAGVEKLIQGSNRANNIRELGNMLGGGGGLGRAVVMGGGGLGTGAIGSYLYGADPIAGGAIGLFGGLAGRGLRTYGNYRAMKGAEDFAQELRKRSPEYAARVATAPTEIGPGLTSSAARGARQLLTIGGGGDIRDAIADALTYQTTGKRRQER